MTTRLKKYTLDTNLFIDGFRTRAANQELVGFHTRFAPFEYLNAVVVQELLSGAQSASDLRALREHVVDLFVRRGRVVHPSYTAWEQSGVVLSELARRGGLDMSAVSKSFGKDILLALSCRESGLTLITRNLKDFRAHCQGRLFRVLRSVALEQLLAWISLRLVHLA